MQIISSRTFLFQKEEYTAEVVDGKETGRNAYTVTERIIVKALNEPQIVPAWVVDTDLFKAATEDGTIVEVQVKNGVKGLAGVNNNTKNLGSGAPTPVAEVVTTGTQQQDGKQLQTDGWATGTQQQK